MLIDNESENMKNKNLTCKISVDDSEYTKKEKLHSKISIDEQIRDQSGEQVQVILRSIKEETSPFSNQSDEEIRIRLKAITEKPFPIDNLISPRLASPRKVFDSVSQLHHVVLASTIIKEKHKLRIAYYCYRSWRVAFIAHRYCRMKMASQFFTEWLEYINLHSQDKRQKRIIHKNKKQITKEKKKQPLNDAPYVETSTLIKKLSEERDLIEITNKSNGQLFIQGGDCTKDNENENRIEKEKEESVTENVSNSLSDERQNSPTDQEFVSSTAIECDQWKEKNINQDNKISLSKNANNSTKVSAAKFLRHQFFGGGG